ncbi:26374_t:CDS:2, partial [Racocetra persica]
LIPKPFPLTGMEVTLPINEAYGGLNPDELVEYAFKPADFRLFYDENNVRNMSLLWSQAAALIGRKNPASDGCARIYNRFITKKTNNFSYADVKDCYEGIPFNNTIASEIIETIIRLLDGFYPFLNKAKEPPQPGFSFKSMDILAALERLKKEFIQFYTDCFSTFTFHTNITLYSVVNDDGEQKIKVFNDTIDSSNVDCEVTHINGRQAISVILEFAQDSVFSSRDIGVRFNTALDLVYLEYSFSVRTELPRAPSIIYTLKCDNQARSFNVTRNWIAFSTPSLLNRFHNSKTYFTNICNATKENKPISYSHGLGEIKRSFNNIHNIIAKQTESIAIIKLIDDFIVFVKEQDFGVVIILTEHYANVQNKDGSINFALLANIIQGFKDLANTGIVLDLSNNLGGYVLITVFINLLLFPNSYPTFNYDFRITEPMRLAITEQFKLATPNNIFDMSDYANAIAHANFTSANDIFGNNIFNRGGIIENYSKKLAIAEVYLDLFSKFIQNLTTPLPWKPEDYIILTNGLCGSACAMIAQHAVEFNNVSTVSVGGIASIPLLSYSSFPGGFVTTSDEILNSLDKLGLQNNTIMPRRFPLTRMNLFTETYSKLNSDKLLDYEFRPADFRLFYNEKNIRNITLLWSQAAALIGKKN